MRTIGKTMILVLLALTLGSCTTITFMSPDKSDVSFPADGKYEILGRITLESAQTSAGYMLLLEAAQEKYPEADDVVNIIIDRKTKVKNMFFIFRDVQNTYMLSGIAIKYTD